MPLYTIRARMRPLPNISRGADFIEMTHHMHWDSDAQAQDAMPNLVGRWNDSPIQARWLCIREELVHELKIFRRDINDASSWTWISDAVFSLPPWVDIPIPIEVGEVTVEVPFKEGPIFPHRRGAVLVREATSDNKISRRVYVGPVSPVAMYGTLPFGLLNISLWVPNIFNGDYPMDPFDDTVDGWRPDIRDLCRDHVANIENEAGDGYSVVPSWRTGTILPVLKVQGGTVRSELRSRGMRYPMGPPTTG